jgi:hypothetical protein
MIPAFTEDGILPPGVHVATWDEIVARFGTNRHREKLLVGLKAALDQLRLAGCRRAFLDGSFVSNKARPGDYDLCYEPMGVDPSSLDPSFFQFAAKRAAQRTKFLGELFPSSSLAANGYSYFQYFQQDTRTGIAKGIVAIDLRGLP